MHSNDIRGFYGEPLTGGATSTQHQAKNQSALSGAIGGAVLGLSTARKVPALMECGDIIPALENLLNVQAAYARGDNTTRAMRDVARKAFEAELRDFLERW